MRKFKLWNEEVTEFIDMSSDKCFAKDPDGLGIEMKLDIVESDNGYYLQNRKESNTPIAFTLIFGIKGNAYESYDNFTGFINQYPKLVLEYQTNDQTLYRDVYLQRLGKSEKTIYNTLECKVTLLPISPWYIPKIIEADYTYSSAYGNQFYNIDIEHNSGDSPINVEISVSNGTNNQFYGARITVDNRVYYPNGTMWKSNETQVVDFPNRQFFKISYSGVSNILKVNTVDKKLQLIRGDGVIENLYGVHDLSKQSFLYLRNGTNNIAINPSGTLINASLHIKITYRRYV